MYSGVVFLSLALTVAAYSTGPPVGQANHASLCTDMTPGHDVDAQTGNAPYAYVLSQQCYKEGMEVKVAIKATNHDTIKYFEGYLTQVQKDGTNGANYGTFTTGDAEYSKTYDCFSKAGSAVGHKKKEHFTARVFTWTAPALADLGDPKPDLVFRTTIVKNKETFWVDFKSPAITYKADCAAGTTFSESNTVEPSDSHEATEEPAEEPTEAPAGGSTALLPGVLAAMATLILAILLQ